MREQSIYKLPYEKEVMVTSSSSINSSKVISKITEGKEMQWDLPGISEIIIKADGTNPVIINFNGKGNKGIWLNAFELSEWK